MKLKRKIFVFSLFLVFLLSSNIIYSEVIIVGGENLIFIDTNHPEKCLELVYPLDRHTCYIWNAALNQEEKFCELLESKDSKTYCYHLLLAYSKNDSCDKTGIYDDYSHFSPNCILSIIQEKNDINICEKIKTGSSSYCYAYFAIKQNNPLVCDKSNNLDYCYRSVAIGLGDIKLCEKIKETEFCILTVALKNQRLRECVKAGWARDSCYKEIAVLREDKNLCKKIVDSFITEECLKYIELKQEDKKRYVKIFGLSEDTFKEDEVDKHLVYYALILLITGIVIFFYWKKELRNKKR